MVFTLPPQLRNGDPVPVDVRLMNALARGLLVVGLAGAGLAGVWALMRAPWMPVQGIRVDSELQRTSLPTIRANALPKLSGTFLSLDLQRARQAFEAVPWVRHAEVRRVWPGQLSVHLEEHQPAALLRLPEAEFDKLVNLQGEVFEANVGEVEDLALPVLVGEETQAAQMLQFLNELRPLFKARDRDIEQLELSRHGAWRLQLEGDVRLELGRGSPDEVLHRVRRFLGTITQVVSQFSAPLVYADLRHVDAYAVKLRGVSTLDPKALAAKPKTPVKAPAQPVVKPLTPTRQPADAQASSRPKAKSPALTPGGLQ